MEDDNKTAYNYKATPCYDLDKEFGKRLISLPHSGLELVSRKGRVQLNSVRRKILLLLNRDYYKILEVEYDASDEKIRLNYRKLALKWHPDKHKCNDAATTKFQEINEAYSVLSDPDKRLDYDLNGNYEINNYSLPEYLARFKGMILTCNGLGISQDSVWSEQLTEFNKLMDK